jgi:hypothetical protein
MFDVPHVAWILCIADPMCPLTCDTCHPLKGPRVITASSAYHTWHSLLGPSGGRSMRDPPVFSLVSSTTHMCESGSFGSLGLRDSRGLECGVEDKLKGSKEALRISVVQNFGRFGMLECMFEKGRRLELHGIVSRIQNFEEDARIKIKECSLPKR